MRDSRSAPTGQDPVEGLGAKPASDGALQAQSPNLSSSSSPTSGDAVERFKAAFRVAHHWGISSSGFHSSIAAAMARWVAADFAGKPGDYLHPGDHDARKAIEEEPALSAPRGDGDARLIGDLKAVLAHHRFVADRIGQPGCEVRRVAAEHAETIVRAIAALSPVSVEGEQEQGEAA